MLASLPLMPEWYLLIGMLGVLAVLGLAWAPLLWTVPLLLCAIAAPLIQALLSAGKAEFPTPHWSSRQRLGLRFLTALLHLLQPLARLIGRLRFGLTLWRRRTGRESQPGPAQPASVTVWSEAWLPAEDWLDRVRMQLAVVKIPFTPGGDYDSWDLQVNAGLLGGARLLMAVEEHGAGRQLLKFSIRKRFPPAALVLLGIFSLLTLTSLLAQAWFVCGVLGCMALLLAAKMLHEASASVAVFSVAIRHLQNGAVHD